MSGPKVRASLSGIPAYTPGRPPAAREGGAAYKLSSNETPYDPLPSVRSVIDAEAAQVNRYPDMACSALYTAISERFSLPVTALAAGTGSVAVLYHLIQALCEPGDEVVYAWRSFEAYPIAIVASGARPVAVPLGDGARHDLDAMAAAITDRTRVVMVCTPNNPTGPVVRADELETFLDRVPADVLVVVDEAYAEFVRDEAAADGFAAFGSRDNVAVLRTFSKAYGLAGLRVGYAVAPESVAAAVRKVALPFGVSGIAQAAAVASLDPVAERELMDRVDALVAERERVVGGLTEAGWSVPATEANFVWLPLDGRGQATDFAVAADEAGITVRPFADHGVRVTIAEPVANDIFMKVASNQN
ncbi:MAG: histidinol-phosphate transaminase [Nocardioidaceae bacterium]|jgi:histidinol-phosphate aminotransferase|nr:histidinol-phosphate transaminase [Nocardioidaceae bacterium]